MIDERAIVIDNGSGTCKAGFSGESIPNLIFPSIIGTANPKGILENLDPNQFFVGNDAQEKRGLLSLRYPIKHGVVINWDHMEAIWDYTFRRLGVDPGVHPVLLTEPPFNPLRNRERMVQVMFESFSVPSNYVGTQAVLALYASGRTTGLVLDSGDGVTHVVPVYGGYALVHAVQRIDLAGRDLTELLVRLLTEQGYQFSTSAEGELVREVKEKLCYVAGDFDVELGRPVEDVELDFETEDGRVLRLGTERFRCPEALFQPNLLGMEASGIHHLTHTAIMKSDIDIRTELWNNIILSGGNTHFEGFSNRLQKELYRVAPGTVKIKVSAPSDRRYSVWNGGSIISSLEAFQDMWIWKEEYEEVGPIIVHRKCF